MGKILNFKEAKQERTPGQYYSGEARCLACKHEWVAVTSTSMEFECPECGRNFGCFQWPFYPEEYWTCGCGNEVFSVGRKGVMCLACGQYQNLVVRERKEDG